jgi:hypothetical protein
MSTVVYERRSTGGNLANRSPIRCNRRKQVDSEVDHGSADIDTAGQPGGRYYDDDYWLDHQFGPPQRDRR